MYEAIYEPFAKGLAKKSRHITHRDFLYPVGMKSDWKCLRPTVIGIAVLSSYANAQPPI